jgi:hypothetical protein
MTVNHGGNMDQQTRTSLETTGFRFGAGGLVRVLPDGSRQPGAALSRSGSGSEGWFLRFCDFAVQILMSSEAGG